ncbi:MAG: hypothetical protein SGARI_005719, partial [Bacillariaceae sp.]
ITSPLRKGRKGKPSGKRLYKPKKASRANNFDSVGCIWVKGTNGRPTPPIPLDMPQYFTYPCPHGGRFELGDGRSKTDNRKKKTESQAFRKYHCSCNKNKKQGSPENVVRFTLVDDVPPEEGWYLWDISMKLDPIYRKHTDSDGNDTLELVLMEDLQHNDG